MIEKVSDHVRTAMTERFYMEGRIAERGDIVKAMRESGVRTEPQTAGTTSDFYLDDHVGYQFPALGSYSAEPKGLREFLK